MILTYRPVKHPRLVRFRSLLKLGYALYLDSKPSVKRWEHRAMWTNYQDGFTGRTRRYLCEFRVILDDSIEFDGEREYAVGAVEHVEVQPLHLQTHEDKYLYARNVVPNWRFIRADEITCAEDCIRNLDVTRVCSIWSIDPKAFRQVVWTVDEKVRPPDGHVVRDRQLLHGRIRRTVLEKKGVRTRKRRPRVTAEQVLPLVKDGLSQYQIAGRLGVSDGAVRNALDNGSYVVLWSRKGGATEIRRATKLVWSRNVPRPQVVRAF